MKIKALGNKENKVIVIVNGSLSANCAIDEIAERLKNEFYVITAIPDGFYKGSKDFNTPMKQARMLNIALKRIGVEKISLLHGIAVGGAVAALCANILEMPVENYYIDSFEFHNYPLPLRNLMYFRMKKQIYESEKSVPFMSNVTIKKCSDAVYGFKLPDLKNTEMMRFFFNYSLNEPAHKCKKKLMKKYPLALYSDYPGNEPCGFMNTEPGVYAELLRHMVMNTEVDIYDF